MWIQQIFNTLASPISCRRAAALAWLCLLTTPAVALDFGRIPPEEVALYVQDLHTGQVLLQHRADASVNPASTMKLVTTFAALRALGPDYRWHTEFKSDAPVRDGVLQGNLYWQGSGSPVFDQPDLQDMQAQLRLLGISRIGGQVVLDRSVWGSSGSADGFEADEGALFVTPPDPHMVAYKVLWATAGIDAEGNPQFDLNPPLADTPRDIQVAVANRPARCGKLANYLSIQHLNGVLQFRGRLPQSCVGEKMFVNLFDAPTFARQSFSGHWLATGGNAVTFAEGRTPPQARTLAANNSKPLAEVLTDMNKFSNNLIARSVFLAIGEHESVGKHSVQNAKGAVRRQLVAAGLDDEALVLENGSGLSRRERLTARFMGQMLQQAWQSPFQAAFIDTLPIGGRDGTLKGRFKNSGGGLRLKTGTLKNVRALAGYWLPENPQQHPLAIVVIINSERSGGYLPDMDKLVERVLNDTQALEKTLP